MRNPTGPHCCIFYQADFETVQSFRDCHCWDCLEFWPSCHFSHCITPSLYYLYFIDLLRAGGFTAPWCMPFVVSSSPAELCKTQRNVFFVQPKDQCMNLLNSFCAIIFPWHIGTLHQLPSHSHSLEGSVRSGSRSERTRNDVGAKPLVSESLFLSCLWTVWTSQTSHLKLAGLYRWFVVRQWIAEAQAASAQHVAVMATETEFCLFILLAMMSTKARIMFHMPSVTSVTAAAQAILNFR